MYGPCTQPKFRHPEQKLNDGQSPKRRLCQEDKLFAFIIKTTTIIIIIATQNLIQHKIMVRNRTKNRHYNHNSKTQRKADIKLLYKSGLHFYQAVLLF